MAFTCENCGQIYSSKFRDSKKWQCIYCTKKGVQKCSYCDIYFKTWSEYFKHLENPKEYHKK